jgi:hypothetical protein
VRGRRLDGFKFADKNRSKDSSWIFSVGNGVWSSNWTAGSIWNRPDQSRTRRLQSRGYRVLRFWDNDVLNNPLAALEAIARELRTVAIPAAAGVRPNSCRSLIMKNRTKDVIVALDLSGRAARRWSRAWAPRWIFIKCPRP